MVLREGGGCQVSWGSQHIPWDHKHPQGMGLQLWVQRWVFEAEKGDF